MKPSLRGITMSLSTPETLKRPGAYLKAAARALLGGRRCPRLLLALGLLLTACVALLPAGCTGDSGGSAKSDNKIKVSFLGLTCEMPIFAAYENGYFKEEGLEPELVKLDWDSLREGL